MKRFYDNDYTLLDKNKKLVSKTIWSKESCGGTLNPKYKDNEIMLESEKIKGEVYHLIVLDVSEGESFVPCNSLSEEQQLVLAKEYELV